MKKIKLTWTLVVCLMLASLVFQQDIFAQTRDKEVAVVYQKKSSSRHLPLCSIINELAFKPELVSMDIFLPDNKSKRDNYKRIVISADANCFTSVMHEGMNDYVKNGGLLITNSALNLIDTNKNYKWDKDVDTSYGRKKGGNPLVGVLGYSSVYMTKIKVESACPLTEGLPQDEWTDLEIKAGGSKTKNYSATVLITSDSIYNDKPHKNQPFLAYKHLGEGACIYIVPVIKKVSAANRSTVEDKYIRIILKNALSEKTLNWLTTNDVL